MDINQDFSFHKHKEEVLNWDAKTQEKLAGETTNLQLISFGQNLKVLGSRKFI